LFELLCSPRAKRSSKQVYLQLSVYMRTASCVMKSRDVLCCAMPYCTVLCRTVLCCRVVICCFVLCCAVLTLCRVVSCRVVSCLALLSCPTVPRLAPPSQCAPRLNLFNTILYSYVVSFCKSQVILR